MTRIAELPPHDGRPTERRQVSVPGLPLSLDDDSIRARIITPRGLGAPRAGDVHLTLSVERSGEELAAADDAELEQAVVSVIEQKAIVEQIARELERLGQFELRARTADGEDKSVPKSPIGARLELIEARVGKWRQLHEEHRSASKELAVRQRLVRTLKDRNERASTARAPRSDELRKCAVVTIVGGSQHAPSELAIEYLVDGARWAPAYVAHLDADGTSARIGARAVIAQRTGEDWTNVAMTLVTATSDTVTALPKLNSLRIGRRQKPPQTGWRPAPLGTDALFGDFERAFGRAALPASTLAQHELFDSEGNEETTAVSGETARLAAPPPPPPPSAAPAGAIQGFERAEPMPQDVLLSAIAQAAPEPKSRGFGISRGRKSKAKKMASGMGGGAVTTALFNDLDGLAEAEAEEERAIRADEILLDYGGYVMAAPDATRRGRLVYEEASVRYRAELVHARWTVAVDIGTALSRAQDRARSVANVALPPGHRVAEDEDFDYSYFADTRVDVPSDGSFHSIALTSSSGPCELRYQVCPRESCDAFRIARLSNPLEAPLLVGPIDVYLAGEFLLSTKTRFTPPGGVMRFGLGVEQAIRVVRNTSFRDDSAGLLGGSRELHHQIRVEAQNHLDRNIELEVRERVPVTRKNEDEIKVELGNVTPRWEAFTPGDDEEPSDKLKGGYRWMAKLAPAEKVELKASYSIRIASKHELVGGNRREQ